MQSIMNATRNTKRSRRACTAETIDDKTVGATTTTATRASPEWLLVTGQPGCGKTTAVKTIVEFLQARGQNCRGFYTDEVLSGDDTTTTNSSKTRIGFDVVSVPDGKRGILSRKAGHGAVSTGSRYKTGQYFVDVASFEAIALPSLETRTTSTNITNDSLKTEKAAVTKAQKKRKANQNGGSQTTSTKQDDGETILVLDEIGRMELHSKAFSDRVRELLMIDEGETQNNHNVRSRPLHLVGAITAPIYGHRVPFCDEVVAQEGVEVHKLTKKTRDRVLQELLQSVEDKGWC